MSKSIENQSEGCLFCDFPKDRVLARNELAFVIRDRYPVTPLHTLVVPKRHVSGLFDLEPSEMKACNDLLLWAKDSIREEDAFVAGFNVWKNDLPDDAKPLLSAGIRNIREAVELAAGRFALEKRERRASDDAFGKLPYCWQILEEAKASRLVRYGNVAEGLDRELDPLIETIITLVLEMESILQRIREG